MGGECIFRCMGKNAVDRYDDLRNAPQSSWLGYFTLLDMDAAIGNDFEGFIANNKPIVFTKEDVDPYVCGHQASRCASKVSEVYEASGTPMSANGEKCKNFIEFNV